jgi:hypothetical protein
MKRRQAPARRQETPQELRDHCLDFLRRKFYPNHAVNFAKDRPRLLAWVVLWPAKWFNEKGVTVSYLNRRRSLRKTLGRKF